MYHDVFASYRFGARSGAGWSEGLLKGLEVQLGVKNVFKTIPPFQSSNDVIYMSSYGDVRLRDISLSIKKAF